MYKHFIFNHSSLFFHMCMVQKYILKSLEKLFQIFSILSPIQISSKIVKKCDGDFF